MVRAQVPRAGPGRLVLLVVLQLVLTTPELVRAAGIDSNFTSAKPIYNGRSRAFGTRRDDKLLATHIPKCGGTALCYVLQRFLLRLNSSSSSHLSLAPRQKIRIVDGQGRATHKPAPVDCRTKGGGVGDGHYEGLGHHPGWVFDSRRQEQRWLVTILRNPISRVVSGRAAPVLNVAPSLRQQLACGYLHNQHGHGPKPAITLHKYVQSRCCQNVMTKMLAGRSPETMLRATGCPRMPAL
eukprot:scaffold7708_cov497-Prasinococcus_capsulatus_cf.AAC.1